MTSTVHKLNIVGAGLLFVISLLLAVGWEVWRVTPASAQFPLTRSPARDFFNPDSSTTTRFQVGSGTGYARNTGTANIQSTAVATTAVTTEEDLLTYPGTGYPASSLNGNNKGFRLRASGRLAANANTKTVRVRLGASTNQTADLLGGNIASGINNAQWTIALEAIRLNSTTLKVSVIGGYGSTFFTYSSQTVIPAGGSFDFTAALPIRLTGQNGTAAANDIIADAWTIDTLN